MLKEGKSFKQLKSIIIIRNLFLLVFKISVATLSILFIAIIAFIIILSTKPRVIPLLNNYIFQKIDHLSNNKINFNKNHATLTFKIDLGLEYKINDLTLKTNFGKFKLTQLIINFDFTKLLFGKININNIILSNSFLEIDLLKNKKEKNEFNYKKLIESLQGIVSKISNGSIILHNFVLNDFDIFIFKNNIKNNIKIIDSQFNLNLRGKNLVVNQKTLFNINNNINSKINFICKNVENKIECKLDLQNINLNNFTPFFDKMSIVYNYINNIKGNFNSNMNFVFDKKLKLENGKIYINSSIGNFYLKQFFDEKIDFTALFVEANFENNFKIFNLNSVKANFDKTEFMMSMFYQEKKQYKNIDLNFDIKKIPLVNLKQLWPNFLGQKEEIRPWVIEHVVGGISPKATAKMNIKYFNKEDADHDSGLQNIYSEVEMNKVLLNYDNYFPEIKNIDGLAIFTKENMLIKINSGNVLKSQINNGSVAINFTKSDKNIIIKAKTNGPFADLFTHIDKRNANIIKSNVNDIIEDYYTTSNITLDIPINDNVNFTTTNIIVDCNLLNKKNSILKNSSNIFLSFIKQKNSDEFFGNLDFTKSNLEFLELNLYKKAEKSLSINYKAYLKDSIVYLTEFYPLENYLNFNVNGYVDLNNKQQAFDITNIEYENSKYNIYYNSYFANDKIKNKIIISGRNIDYTNIIKKIKNMNFNNTDQTKINNSESKIQLNLDYLSFINGNKLVSPTLIATFENNTLNTLNFDAFMNNEKYVKVHLNKKNNMFNLTSDDFGTLFQKIDLTNNIIGGNGEINLNKKNIKGKDIIVGNLKINKKFSIVTNEDVKKDVLSDVEEDKNFKNLKQSLNKKGKISFDKMVGNFTYNDDIFNLDDVVLNSKFISFQILAYGFINLKTEQIQIEGLLIPLGLINGLFGANKLPVISEIIFGQKDGGLFASKFFIIKQDKKSKIDININKFSMILPGFLRDIFNKNNYSK